MQGVQSSIRGVCAAINELSDLASFPGPFEGGKRKGVVHTVCACA